MTGVSPEPPEADSKAYRIDGSATCFGSPHGSAVPVLEQVFPGAKGAIDAVRWEWVSARMEAAYTDSQPPQFFRHWVEVYRAGHLPVGWDADSGGFTVLVC